MALQIKPHYHIEIVEPKQVYLLGEQGSHALSGQLYCQILPLLDGHHSREQIAAKLNGAVPLDHIDHVLNRLLDKGYLTEAAPALPAEAAAFWSELGLAPAQAARALRQPVRLQAAGNRITPAMVDLLSAALGELGVPHEVRVTSAHRTPEEMIDYGKQAADRGLQVIIAGAGGAAHLPGMLASVTMLPVIGVPVRTSALSGMDSLLSIVQMPRGVPVATVAVDNATNAGLLAAQILALNDPALATRLADWRAKQTASVAETPRDDA